MSRSDQPSGAANRKAAHARKVVDAERERERSGLLSEWDELLVKLGPPPLDPVANSEWANSLAAGMAFIVAKDRTIPLEDRAKRVAELLDRVAYSQSKASVAKRIREVKEGAGVPTGSKRNDGVVLVGAGTAIRARNGIHGAAHDPEKKNA